MVGQQPPTSIEQVDSEEPASTGHKGATIIRHATNDRLAASLPASGRAKDFFNALAVVAVGRNKRSALRHSSAAPPVISQIGAMRSANAPLIAPYGLRAFQLNVEAVRLRVVVQLH